MAMEAEQITKINWPAIIVVIIGTFMAILDSSIVNVAIPKMMAVFGAPQDTIEWVVTGYMLTLGVVMPLTGFLGDTIGYKKLFIIVLSIFITGSALCGLAWNVESLIAARVIQAIGGGMMQPLSMTILYKNAPRSKIGMVMGVWGIAAMVAPAIGPTLGGYLVDYANWRMIFYINLPIGIINLFLAMVNLKETELIKGQNFDKFGVVFSSVGFFCVLMALSKAASKGWTSPMIVGLLLVSFFSLLTFVIIELHHPEPLLDLRLFKNYIYSLSIIISSIISFSLFGAIFLIPIYLQNTMGVSAMVSGLITLPASLAAGLMMPIAGRIFDKYGPRLVSIVGLLIITCTTYMMHDFNLATPFAFITIIFTLRGLGMGLANMPVNTAGMNTVPIEKMGRASALGNVIRQIAASFGVAIFTTILQTREVFHFANLANGVNMNSNQALAMQKGLSVIASNHGLNIKSVQSAAMAMIGNKIALMAAVNSVDDCFVVAAALCLLAMFLCFFLKAKKSLPNVPAPD